MSGQIEEVSAGFARYTYLPLTAQARLAERLSGKGAQYVVPLEGVLLSYLFLLLAAAWFVLLFFLAGVSEWSVEGMYWILGFSTVAALAAGLSLHSIIRWHCSPLRRRLMVTPLYFVKTDLDKVWFWPLWDLQDVKVTHLLKKGSFYRTDLQLTFKTGTERFRLYMKGAADRLLGTASDFEKTLRAARQRGNSDYVTAEDDFYGWRDREHPVPPKVGTSAIVAAGLALGAAGLLVVIAQGINTKIYPPTPGGPVVLLKSGYPSMPTPTPAPSFSEPELALPPNGEVQRYTEEPGVAPFEIHPSKGSNYLVKLVDAETKRPVLSVFVHGGETKELKVPLGTYIVRYASGQKWYGYSSLFGPKTAYSQAEKKFQFTFDGNEYSGYTITLYRVSDGNLRTKEITPSEF